MQQITVYFTKCIFALILNLQRAQKLLTSKVGLFRLIFRACFLMEFLALVFGMQLAYDYLLSLRHTRASSIDL